MTRITLTLLFALIVATSIAQPPQLPFGGPGGPPFGGFGPPPGMGGGLIDLLGMSEVQTELSLTQEQQAKVHELTEETRREMAENFQRAFADDDQEEPSPPEARFAAMRQKMDALAAKTNEQVQELLEKPQWERLEQLQLQREGMRSPQWREIAKSLELTEEQLGKLRGVLGGTFGPAPVEPFSPKVTAALNDDQKLQWATLVGKPFEFPRSMGFGGPPGFGPGGPGAEEVKLVDKFDANKDGWLNQTEREEARDSHQSNRQGPRGGRGGPPRGFGFGRAQEPGTAGPRVAKEDVAPISNASLYDLAVVRTLFLDFENDDWEDELEAFHGTDVEVPAMLTVDGVEYPNVGVSFRGMSSFMMIPKGSKRSLNVSVDLAAPEQRLLGSKTLNLLNSHEDPTFFHTALYSKIAREHIPTPKANFVKVVINGESWGVYVNAQQFDKLFVKENFGQDGARWKVRGNPGARAGLEYVGDKVEDYKRTYQIKSGDKDEDWHALINLCRTLDQTPPGQLEAALEPILDVDGALWFLALDNALINSDGYWIRASDYSIFRDARGKFHLIPHDMNEAFQRPMGPGFGGPGRRRTSDEARGANQSNGYELDPLIGLDDVTKPLRSKLLAVPRLRERYLSNVRAIAEDSLDWAELGPYIAILSSRIAEDVKADTRKLSSWAEFESAVGLPSADNSNEEPNKQSLREFATERRRYLLDYPDINRIQDAKEEDAQ
ncbi:CotH kinase family protein [Lacipirellula parvula]|uniref:CotH kinase family protein n=1 Tax=Lacipirellula parvula TaxID=2650471 RepID=UPI001E54ACAA|nr:CotH kinase family protein [Lacipirellula parvula]